MHHLGPIAANEAAKLGISLSAPERLRSDIEPAHLLDRIVVPRVGHDFVAELFQGACLGFERFVLAAALLVVIVAEQYLHRSASGECSFGMRRTWLTASPNKQ